MAPSWAPSSNAYTPSKAAPSALPGTRRGPPPTVTRPDLFPKSADQADLLRTTKKGTLWTDPDFPPTNASLFGKSGKGSSGMAKVSAWLRPDEFAPLQPGETHRLVYGDAAAGDVVQGGLGDCYLLGALSTAAASHVDGYSRLKQNVLPSDGESFADPPEWRERGFFTFRFYIFGEWVQVSVDTLIPCGADRRPAFARCVDPRELWVLYLEKAYAKLHGSYAAIEGGSLTAALVDLTGGFAEEIDLRSPSARAEVESGRLWQRLLRYQRLGYLMGCAVTVPGGETLERTPENLMQNHAYGILLHYEQRATNAAADEAALRLVKIRNPWGQGEWTGAWADEAAEWRSETGRYAMQQLDYTFDDDGTFFMEFADYAAHINTVYVCKILRDADWHRAELHDEWSTAAGTAGGCFNFPTWRANPQWVLRVSEPTHAHFVLLQPDSRVSRSGGATQSHTIGMYIMRGHERFLRRVLVNSDEIDGDEIVDSTDFVLRREVSCNTLDEEGEMPLVPGVPYVLVPSSFYPHKDGTFKLIMYTQSEVGSLERVPALLRQQKRGQWIGRSAGGPEGGPTWKLNPQFLMHARGASDDRPARVSIVLHRRDPDSEDPEAGAKGVKRKGLAAAGGAGAGSPGGGGGSMSRRGGGSTGLAGAAMSFVVAHADPQHAHLADRRTLRIPKRDVVDRAEASLSAEVGSEFVLKEACTFVIVPSTGERGQQGEFTLDVYSDQQVVLEDVKEWTAKTIQGEWRGRSAGGCRNTQAWVANPMYWLSAPEPGGGGGDQCVVHGFISQPPRSLRAPEPHDTPAHAPADAESGQPPGLEGIGFYVLPDTDDLGTTPPAVNSGYYTAEEVGAEFSLKAGARGAPRAVGGARGRSVECSAPRGAEQTRPAALTEPPPSVNRGCRAPRARVLRAPSADAPAVPCRPHAGARYILVPTSYRKGFESAFSVQLFSEEPLECRRLKPAEHGKLANTLYEEYAAGVLQRVRAAQPWPPAAASGAGACASARGESATRRRARARRAADCAPMRAPRAHRPRPRARRRRGRAT